MFVQNLNLSQQEVLLSMAKNLISVDGVVDERELGLLSVLKSQCEDGVSETVTFDFSLLKELFTAKSEKVSLMLELIGIAHADEEYCVEEKAFIKEVADNLKLSTALLKDLEGWVKRQMILVKEAKLFMEV